jgi:cysteine desulfurase
MFSLNPLYLDHNATTPLLPEVAEAMALVSDLANPASQHAAGRRARQVLEQARDSIATLLGLRVAGPDPDRLVFTSSATEANNLALFGLMGETQGRILVSSLEHPSVMGVAEELARRGSTLEPIRATSSGQIDLLHLAELLAQPAQCLALMAVNNETGVIQPVAQVATRAAAAGVPLHCDAVQAVGKMPVSFRDLGVATLSLSAHKFHGPKGIGALIVRGDLELQPHLFGGHQQHGLRPGTESVPLVVGLARALELCHEQAAERQTNLTRMQQEFERQLQERIAGLVINGEAAPRLPHTSNIGFVGLDRQALVIALDLAGVCCSTGSACASGSSEVSPVLQAMGCRDDVLRSSLRFSFGATTSVDEIGQAVDRISRVCNELHSRIQARKTA